MLKCPTKALTSVALRIQWDGKKQKQD